MKEVKIEALIKSGKDENGKRLTQKDKDNYRAQLSSSSARL